MKKRRFAKRLFAFDINHLIRQSLKKAMISHYCLSLASSLLSLYVKGIEKITQSQDHKSALVLDCHYYSLGLINRIELAEVMKLYENL